MHKKIYIIGGVVLIVLIGAVIAILSLKNGRSELASKIQQAQHRQTQILWAKVATVSR